VPLPSGDRVVCGGFSSRYEGIDELALYLPLGALDRVDPRIGGYPFDESSGVESFCWRAPLDRWRHCLRVWRVREILYFIAYYVSVGDWQAVLDLARASDWRTEYTENEIPPAGDALRGVTRRGISW